MEKEFLNSTEIGLTDKNGNDICQGYVIKHNDNEFLILWSHRLNEFIGQTTTKNMRYFNQLKNIAPHSVIITNILFDTHYQTIYAQILDNYGYKINLVYK